MKNLFICLLLLFSPAIFAGEIEKKAVVIPKQPKVWQTFLLSEVRLLPGSPFHHAMKVSQQYLLDMNIDKMLDSQREQNEIPVKGQIYPGSNQPDSTRAGDLYHYISGISLMYAQTGEQEYLERVNYLIDGLAEIEGAIQKKLEAKGEKHNHAFAKLLEGELILNRPDDAGYPWGGTSGNRFYGIHKKHAAYRDAYLYCDNTKALALWIKDADIIGDLVLRINPDLFDGFLDLEHGGMNAVYADLYALTGDKRYMDVSMKFNHQKVILNIADNKDVLYGRHANFQIPVFEGTARQYQLTGNEVSKKATFNFLEMLYHDHTNCIGGNSCYERFGIPGETTKRLGYTASETCNTYNMLKVALNAFESTGELKHMEYFEKALYNHILASQDPQSGGVTYYTATIPGGFKTYSDRFNLGGVWCCVGTGMENHSKYGEAIYFNNHDALYVNLFIPSELNWIEKGLHIKQETIFPEEDKIQLQIVDNQTYDKPIYIRYPSWIETTAYVFINGEPVELSARPGDYICLNHNWKKGDIVSIEMPQTFRLEAAKDDPCMYTVAKGPVIYAAALGYENMPEDLVKFAGDNNTFVPLDDIPTFVVNKADLNAWIVPNRKTPMEYQTLNAGYLNGKKKDITLIPYYKMHHQRYSLYLKMYTPDELNLRNQIVTDELRPSYEADEKSHKMKGENTELIFQAGHSPALGFNTWEKTRWGREAKDGGWFSYDLKINTNSRENYIVVTYWGNENKDHEFDVLINGVKVAVENLFDKKPLTFYEVVYNVPEEHKGNGNVTVMFRSHTGKHAGTVFALKSTINPWKFPNYKFYF
jgi:DUF1680 family protein